MVAAIQFARFRATGRATCQQGCQWHTTAQAFAEGDDVGAYTVRLFGEQGAAAAHAGLYFVEDQQDA
ncbi:hypothetical protein D3C81_1800700 [compost metagenome]